MLITLKQQEIEDALRLYIENNGILVTGKTVNFAFTAGRAPTGLSVEVDIVNATLAGSAASTGKVVQLTTAAVKAPADEPVVEAAAPKAEPEPAAPAAAPEPELAVAPAGKSLFG